VAETGVLGKARASPSEGLPWTQLFVEALGVAPLWGGLVLAAAQFAFILAYKYLACDPLQVLPDAVFALLLGYSPTASVYARRAALGCLRDLRPALDVTEARFSELVGEVTRWDVRRARLFGAGVLVVTVVILLNEPGIVERYPPGHPVLPLLLWMNLAAVWLGARTIAHEIAVSRRFGRLGGEHAVVDVLDQRPLTPFARRGVQGALVPILLISIFSLLFVSGDAGDAVPFTQALVVTIAAISLLLPIHGVHRRLADQKRDRLARVAAAIRNAEEPVLSARPGERATEATHLHALLALRQQLESAREWPWDVSTLVRFALYVAIGLGSWLGGALVERIVDLALG
jgi:CBS domain-containing protein